MTTTPYRFEPRRVLGRTGFKATALGIGDLADRAVPLEQCVATARRALDMGLNVIDTAPGYENGYSEQIVGQAVRGLLQGRSSTRERVFVIDKIDFFDKPIAGQVDGSLSRLGIDHVDAFVFHGLSSLEKWRQVTAPGGAMDELQRCIQAGKARFAGISCHDPEVLSLAIASGLCDLVMFAVGPYVDQRYIDQCLPLARKHNVGTVCFKVFGAGKLLGDTAGYSRPLQNRPRGKVSSGGDDGAEAVLPRLSVRDCLHYALTCDPDVALLGLSFPNEQDAAFAAYAEYAGPLPPQRMADIRGRAAEAIRDKGPCWWNPTEQ